MSSQFTQSLAAAKPGFDFVAAHFRCERNLYSPDNPDGFVNFGSAQNFLHSETVANLLASCTHDASDAHYQSFSGTQSCRTSIADYLSRVAADEKSPAASATVNPDVDPDNILVGNGIISVLEALAVALLDGGDKVLVPTPVFPGLVNALSVRVQSGVHLMHMSPDNGFRLTPESLDQELQTHTSANRIRAILLSSPGNPVGQVFSAAELNRLLAVAKKHDCALIVDEVYAGSCFSNQSFASAVSLKDDNVYVLGGLSKDFGLAGFATGWLYGTNTNVMRAVAKQAHFYRLPAPVQRVIERALSPDFANDYLDRHRRVLTDRFHKTAAALASADVPVAETNSGLCVWMDLRHHLRTLDGPSELELYEHLLNNHRVHVSPSSGFLTKHRGFYRICFSHQQANLTEGLRRLQAGLSDWSSFRVPAVQEQVEVA